MYASILINKRPIRLNVRCDVSDPTPSPRTQSIKDLKVSLRNIRSKLINVKQQWEEPRSQSIKTLFDHVKTFHDNEKENFKKLVEDIKNIPKTVESNTDIEDTTNINDN